MAELSYKRRKFVEGYLKYWNATKAATEAGYKHPKSQGSRLLTNVDVKAVITKRLRENGMEADEIISRLSEHARADLGDYIDIAGFIDMAKLKEDGKTHLIKKYEIIRTPSGVKYKLETHDPQAALDKLAKIRGKYVNRTEVTGKDGEPLLHKVYIGVSPDDWDDEGDSPV